MQRDQRGYTFVELLVVIGIVSILMAIILSALHSAKLSAQRVVCANQLKQIGVALHMYAQDWYGCVPPYTTETNDYITYGETDPPGVVDLRPFNDAAALKQCYKRYGVTPAMWWCPLDPCPGKEHPVFSMMTDHTQTSYSVDHRVTVWKPMKLSLLPIAPKALFGENTSIFWKSEKAASYIVCWPNSCIAGNFLVLKFDGRVVQEKK